MPPFFPLFLLPGVDNDACSPMDICRQNGTADPYGHNGEAVEVSMDNKVEKKHKEEESEEILPDGWTKHVHPESGSTYYFCEVCGENKKFP